MALFPEPETLSVSQLNRQVKRLLEGHFDFVWVEGELSNLARPGSGHWYFTLKDATAQVRCAMFRNRNQRLRLHPENGQLVRLRCRVSLYEGRGEFQLIAEHMELAGAGALQAAFEQLKAKLQAQGLFDPERKQALPSFPRRIAVITSPSGAAIRDIISVFRRRFPLCELDILPVAVQGQGAATDIAAALALANQLQRDGLRHYDAIICGRGGGSLEDLWAFNEEVVALAIADSRIPVVSAVGHEVDFSIADFVADVRAATPSAAAELLSPDSGEWQQTFAGLQLALERAATQQLRRLRESLTWLRRQLRHPGERLREQSQRLDELEQRLLQAGAVSRRHKSQLLALQSSRLLANSPVNRLPLLRARLHTAAKRVRQLTSTRLSMAQQRLASSSHLLDSLSPLSTLQRGFAVVTDSSGNVLRDSRAVGVGDKISAGLASGSLHCTVDEVVTPQ